MPLHLKLITSPTDYPAMARLKYHAFASNALNQIMYPSNMDPQALQNWFIAREKRDALNPFQRILAVIDSEGEGGEGEIIAYAKWELPTSLVVGDGAPQEELDFGPIPPLPEGANREVCRAFRSGVDGMREKWGDKKEVFELHSLATHPAYQGRGCAGMLLRWGIEQADAAGKKCYLESTPAAFPVYQRYGWVKIDEAVVDAEQFGGQNEIVAIMVREPRKAK